MPSQPPPSFDTSLPVSTKISRALTLLTTYFHLEPPIRNVPDRIHSIRLPQAQGAEEEPSRALRRRPHPNPAAALPPQLPPQPTYTGPPHPQEPRQPPFPPLFPLPKDASEQPPEIPKVRRGPPSPHLLLPGSPSAVRLPLRQPPDPGLPLLPQRHVP